MNNITKSQSFKWSVATALLVAIFYTLTWRLIPMEWFTLVFVDVLIFILYLVVFIGSIIFLIRNRKKYTRPFIPLIITITPIIIIAFAPSMYRNKSYPRGTVQLSNCQTENSSNRLYLESYCVHGSGALGYDLNSLYLTDSVNFRQYIGTYEDQEETIMTKCNRDSISVIKTIPTSSKTEWRQPKIISTQTFSLKKLVKQHSFD